MSGEKNTEVVGCDASIMKNVWEIRAREYGQKMQLELDRIEQSALPSINKDWENRLLSKLGKGKRVERKKKPDENQTNNNNVWKSQKLQVPPTLSRGTGSGPLSRPGGQRRGFSTSASNCNDKKSKDKNLNRLQLLMFITQTQPSTMVWGKSWKYNKSLPSPEEGAAVTPDWGMCWMFASPQPRGFSQEGKSWLNGPDMIDPHSLYLWKKSDYRVVESQELDLSLPSEKWQTSWRKSDKKKVDSTSGNEENMYKSGFFTLLVKTQLLNEAVCSSEWSESWRSTKPASQQNGFTVPNHGQMNESITNKQDKNREMSSTWEECWRLINHHGSNKSKSPQFQKFHDPEWANSWRAAMTVFNNHKNSDPSLRKKHSGTYDDCSQQRESHLLKAIYMSHEQKYKDLSMQLCNEFNGLLEWNKSWQVTKNNSKPCAEIEKILKVSSSRMETVLEQVEEIAKGHCSTLVETDPCCEKVKDNVIHHPKREFTQSKLFHLTHLNNFLSASEWRESWKTLQHRMSMERRRMRPDSPRLLRDMKTTSSEWQHSWKFTCQSLRQEPECWQQSWSTIPRIRVDCARDQNHFGPVALHKNGPTSESSWKESWRFSKSQHQSEPGQDRTQTNHLRSSVASHHYDNLPTHRSVRHTDHAVSASDWYEAWMVSETQFHHDKPSLTTWRDSWMWSFHTERWTGQMSRDNGADAEIQSQKEKTSFQTAKSKMSQSFENKIFRERYPENQWSTSWRAGSLLNHYLSHYGSSGITGKSTSRNTLQEHVTANEHGFKWGISFRLANPMPHVEQPWVESFPNPCHYTDMWSKENNIQKNNTKFSNKPATVGLWEGSHQFIQGSSAQIKNKTKSKEPVGPRVIITHKNTIRRQLYSDTGKEKQSERKWAGCHLLGKTQPHPKRGPSSVKKINIKDENKDKFLEEWAESWRFLVQPGILKKQMSVKSLSGWQESWKFLLPSYLPNGPKAR